MARCGSTGRNFEGTWEEKDQLVTIRMEAAERCQTNPAQITASWDSKSSCVNQPGARRLGMGIVERKRDK